MAAHAASRCQQTAVQLTVLRSGPGAAPWGQAHAGTSCSISTANMVQPWLARASVKALQALSARCAWNLTGCSLKFALRILAKPELSGPSFQGVAVVAVHDHQVGVRLLVQLKALS